MSPALLAPAFLAGLAALAIPILVHLIHRQRSETLAFPSLMFLHKIPYHSVRRQKLRHRLLLLLRCLALILIVMAFARPFLAGKSQAASLGGGRELVILLDRSYSMGYSNRWERALAEARSAIEGVRPQDRASIVLFSRAAQAAHAPTSDQAQLRAALASASVGSDVTRYGPALKMAQELLESSPLPRREVLLITDFQKVGREGEEEVRLPPGTALRWLDLSDREASNVAVTSLFLQRDYASGRERVGLSARLVSKGPKPVRDFPVALELDGRTVQEKRVSLEANSATTVAFNPIPLPEGTLRGTVRAADDALPPDNAFHFVLALADAVPVLILEGRAARANRSLYLSRALAIGDRPRFRAVVKPASDLAAADLTARPVVILNEASFPAGASALLLRGLLEKGGGVLAVLMESNASTGWPPDLLPGTFGGPVDRTADGGGTLAYLDHSHPVFELFSAPRTGDFSSARFLRYRPLRTEGASGVLARFDDGAIALAERKVGAGRLLVWTSTLDTFWNDLPLKPVFLPFVHQVVKHLAGHAEPRTWFTVGEVVDTTVGEAPPDERVALAPSGERTVLPEGAGGRFLELREAGFHEVRALRARGAPPLVVAANLDRAESDLTPLDPEELAAAVSPRAGRGQAAGREAAESPQDQERRQSFWRFLLMAVLLLLVVETALSNRLSRVVR